MNSVDVMAIRPDPVDVAGFPAGYASVKRLLRAHGLLQKIPRTHRYPVTRNGHKAITASLGGHVRNHRPTHRALRSIVAPREVVQGSLTCLTRPIKDLIILTMNLGKHIRLRRIMSHPSGRLCSVAVDHFIGYQKGLPHGLTNLAVTLSKLAPGAPDAITMLKGAAKNAWAPYAGQIPLIVSSVCFTADDAVIESTASPEEVMWLGGDAIAVAIGVRGASEGRFLKILSTAVEQADRLGLPVIAHIYPRDFSGIPRVVHTPEDVMWAVRCGIECGADVIKVPFTGDAASYREIVDSSPVPVVAAGGPKCDTLDEALQAMAQVVAAGASGATIGRNIWGAPDPAAALRAFKAVIHGGRTPAEALADMTRTPQPVI